LRPKGRRRRPCVLLLPVVVFLIAGGLRVGAQGPIGILYVCDSALDRILGFSDIDHSGAVEKEAPGESFVFYDDSSPGPDLSTPSHLAAGPGDVVLGLDGGSLDAVLAFADKNQDGDANDEGEVSIFYDKSTGGPKLSTPNCLIAAPDGSFYIADDGSAGRRIVRLQDSNGDGDALDADEARMVYNTTALSLPLLEDLESLAISPEGLLFGGDTTQQAIFTFRDLNGNGDFLDADEVTLFFQSAGDLLLTDIESMAFVSSALFVADKSDGRILRLEDKNGDGDAGDDTPDGAEATVFLDATASLKVSGITDFIPLAGGGFLILDNTKDTVSLATDLNGDGDALDDGEVVRWLLDDGAALATPSGLLLVPKEVTPPPPGKRFVRGDATGDGKVDISDPILTLGYLFLGRVIETCLDALDTDDTGKLNISDPILSLNFLFSGGVPPLPPFPEPGIDSTQDAIDC
jgi:hypothetical protein